MKRLWQHPVVVVACNLLLLIGIYTLSRLAFYGFNAVMYPNINATHLGEMLLGGMRFDLTAILYLSSVYILLSLLPLPFRAHATYQIVCKVFYLIPNIIGIAVNCVDMVYIRFTGRRTTMTFFSEFENNGNLLTIFLEALVQYWYVTLFFAAMVILLCRGYRKIQHTDIPAPKWIYYVRETFLLCVSVYLVVIGIRGGFGAYTRPITLSNALEYTNTPEESNIVLNTPFSLMRSTEGRTYHHPHYFPDDELDAIMSPVHIEESDSIRRMNVVVLILESFSTEYIGFYNSAMDNESYTGYTPFLDSLLQYSVTYTQSFASGRKSIDAMPSVLSSIPMLIEPYVLTPYSTNRVSSLADCLGKAGYETAFFHGAPNGSMGFQAYARTAGFAHYYGMDEYDGSSAFDGTWAIWDEEFLQYYARTMSTIQQPFLTACFTASSHHPFRVPKHYHDTFPTGTLPIHPCISYTDHALRKFFAYARTQPWYQNTLFVLTADHTNQLTHPEYTNAVGIFRVPIAFYCPAWHTGKVIENAPISQTDIMPSVLRYLGYNQPYFAFGEDALTFPKQHPYAICYNAPVYQILSDSLLLQFDGQHPTALYHYRTDTTLQNNCLNTEGNTPAVQAMQTYLQAYIQQYISRMLNNRLTYGSEGR